MQSELSFLIDLLLNHRLSKPVKELIAGRIREIEARPKEWSAQATGMRPHPASPTNLPAHLQGQSPSTIANFIKHNPDAADVTPQPTVEPKIDTPVAVATTVATAAAMNARNAAIQAASQTGAFTGKPEPGRTSPRKFRQPL